MAGKWESLTLSLAKSNSDVYKFSIRLGCLSRRVTGPITQMGKWRSQEKKQRLMEGDLAGEGKSMSVMGPWQRYS